MEMEMEYEYLRFAVNLKLTMNTKDTEIKKETEIDLPWEVLKPFVDDEVIKEGWPYQTLIARLPHKVIEQYRVPLPREEEFLKGFLKKAFEE